MNEPVQRRAFDGLRLEILEEKFDADLRATARWVPMTHLEQVKDLILMWESISHRREQAEPELADWERELLTAAGGTEPIHAVAGNSVTGAVWRVLIEAHIEDVSRVGWGSCIRDYHCDDPAYALRDFTLALKDDIDRMQHQPKITILPGGDAR